MIKLIIIKALFLCSVSVSASAFQANSVNFSKSLKALSSSPQYSIAKVFTSPANPRQGDAVSFFVELSTEFQNSKEIRSVVAIKVNGIAKKAQYKSGKLWISEAVILNEVGRTTAEVTAYIEDSRLSEQTQSMLNQLNKDIELLSLQIESETDPAKVAQLQHQRSQKNVQKLDLENTLNSAKRKVATKTQNIEVSAMPGASYPKAIDVTPNYGLKEGGYAVIINGENLADVSAVEIGGIPLPSSELVITNDRITFTVPALSLGMQDIKIFKTVNGQNFSSTLKNAFFALDSSGPSPNPEVLHPVAFAGLPQNTLSNVSVELDGSQSYDENNLSLTYMWQVISKPNGATITDGVIDYPEIANPSFLAVKAGNYVVSLTVSNGTYTSTPSLTVVTVGVPESMVVAPMEINGAVNPGSFYVGMFSICNNQSTKGAYEIMGRGFSLVNGVRAGTISAFSCLPFQFSASLLSNSNHSLNIPILLKGASTITKVIQVHLAPTSSKVELALKFDSDQWNAPTSFDEISKIGAIPLIGAFDAVSVTKATVRNRNSQSISITTPPTITPVSGGSGVITTSFPSEGITIPGGGFYELNIFVDPVSMVGGQLIEAIFEWDIASEPATKAYVLKTVKLPEPSTYLKIIDFGDMPDWGFDYARPFLMHDFVNMPEFGLMQVQQVTLPPLTSQVYARISETTPFLLGKSDQIQMDLVELSISTNISNLGAFSENISVEVSGYNTPFIYTVKGNVFADPLLRHK